MPLTRSELFARWGDLQHAQDKNARASGWADRENAIGLARGAYLDAVRFGAVEDEGESPTPEMSVGLGPQAGRRPASRPSSFTIV
jgi:hypothetical protein